MVPYRNLSSLIPPFILDNLANTVPLPPAMRLKGIAAATIDQFDVCYISSYSDGVAQISVASSSADSTAPGLLFLALSAATAGNEVILTLGPANVPMNTSGLDIGDPVYVNSLGNPSSGAGVVARKIGEVAVAGVIAGSYTFVGSMAALGGTTTTLDSLTMTKTLTSSGQILDVNATTTTATGTTWAIDASNEQTTNARTSGTLGGIRSTVTSLTGTTTGVDHVAFDAVAVAGDADSDHIALRAGAAIDVTIDSRAQTTGKNLWKVGDNLASALSVEEGSNSYFKVVTTNSSERTEIRGPVPVGPTATAITGATALTVADAGRIFTVAQSSAYDIDLPAVPGADYTFRFQLVSAGAFNVTITSAGSVATFEGVIVNDVTSVIPATGSTLTFASGVSALGDYIEVTSTSATKYCVRAICSADGGITVA